MAWLVAIGIVGVVVGGWLAYVFSARQIQALEEYKSSVLQPTEAPSSDFAATTATTTITTTHEIAADVGRGYYFPFHFDFDRVSYADSDVHFVALDEFLREAEFRTIKVVMSDNEMADLSTHVYNVELPAHVTVVDAANLALTAVGEVDFPRQRLHDVVRDVVLRTGHDVVFEDENRPSEKLWGPSRLRGVGALIGDPGLQLASEG